MNKKLNAIFKKSKRLKIDDSTKLVIMSDCHRGAGNNSDNFVKNRNIFKAALNHYYNNGFSYIELGDGDEMWEVKNYKDIMDEHLDSFKILKKFHDNSKLIMIFGNHDKCKESSSILQDYFYKYYNESTKQEETLLNNLIVYESLVLEYKNQEIFMIHGHQIDLLNNNFWKLARFLVRYIWKNLEKIGIHEPTSAAKNNIVSSSIERKLKKWSIENNKIIIAGHTHRPIFPKVGQSLYFNDGSCIHPSGITSLEIENGNITLVKWLFNINKDKSLIVEKQVLDGNEPIINFFK